LRETSRRSDPSHRREGTFADGGAKIMSLLSTFRVPVASGRRWTRKQREAGAERSLFNRLVGRSRGVAADSAEADGFGDQRARAMAFAARLEHETIVARPRPWR
jgi:hypothetical protein